MTKNALDSEKSKASLRPLITSMEQLLHITVIFDQPFLWVLPFLRERVVSTLELTF